MEVKNENLRQYLLSIGMILIITATGILTRSWFDYHTIGYFYLVSVMIASAAFKMGPIFFSAALGSLCWNFFFMEPQFTFHINSSQDSLMYYTFFITACLGGYLNSKIRKHEKTIGMKEESERLYQTLINSISHEIRTPITAILGNSAVLQQENNLSRRDTVLASSREIQKAAERLNQVVENLLDMSRIESGHLTLKREVFPLGDLLDDVLLRMQPHSLQHEILISREDKLNPDHLISGDYKLLDHAISNLLQNAILHSPPHSKIKIFLFSNETSVQLSIHNHGAIPKEYKNRIFEKFFRIPGSRTGGIGLGLSIVKGILQAHDATITLNSEEDSSNFQITFPKAKLPPNIRESLHE